jgi:hypothetical protein
MAQKRLNCKRGVLDYALFMADVAFLPLLIGRLAVAIALVFVVVGPGATYAGPVIHKNLDIGFSTFGI